MKNKLWPIIILLTLLPLGLAAQTAGQTPVAVLEFFDDPFEIEIFDSSGFEIYADYGVELAPGTRLSTKATTAEIRLQPNGSILKISRNTQITIDSLQGRDNAPENGFQLAAGKLRAVAARATGAENKYTIKTPSAVCGVRGTDFGMEVNPGGAETAFVLEGLIDFSKKGDPGSTISLGAGQFADALAAEFAPISLSTGQMDSLFSDLAFERLVPTDVPGKGATAQETSAPAEEEKDEEVEEEPEEPAEEVAEDKETSEETPDRTAVETVEEPTAAADAPKAEEKPQTDAGAGFLSGLGDILGFELGTITINDQVYSKLVLQPVIKLGKLEMGLYLPIIYSANLFDPNDWYQPAGNSEWSFGRDQSDALDATADFARDLALKFKFVQYGNPDMDNFFFGIGNLTTMTIGHGILMRNYANDADFPSIRKLGFNFRLTGNHLGIEGVSDDLTNVDIVGGRVFLRPFGDKDILNLGVSSVVDIAPASDLEDPALYGNPLFITSAVDLELFKINTDPFSLMAYVDGGAMIPYFRNTVINEAVGDVTGGFKHQVLYNRAGIHNYGIIGGFRGNVLILDWTLEYRFSEGFFRPTFFGPTYDRDRGAYLDQTLRYLQDPAAEEFNRKTMGIYGEGGFTLFKVIHLNAGYFWPWSLNTAGQPILSNDDSLKLGLILEKGLLPIDIEGAVSYEKRHFAETLRDPEKKLTLFDDETIFQGELVYPISGAMKLAFVLSTAISRDEEGNVVYQADGFTPEVVPTVNIESRLSF